MTRLGGLVLLASLAACKNGEPAAMDGPSIFRGTCARCHGESGTGGPPQGGIPPRNFHDHDFQASRTDADLKNVIVNGKGTAMPAFGKTFSDAELASLVAYVRTFDPKGPTSAVADGGVARK